VGFANQNRPTRGRNIASQGLYELGVTETLWRLTESGDLMVDAGANIRAASRYFESLGANVELWRKDGRCGSFDLHQAALGKEKGKARLHINDVFLRAQPGFPSDSRSFYMHLYC
jgi:hypothetical protein